jgi:hypothetical protein
MTGFVGVGKKTQDDGFCWCWNKNLRMTGFVDVGRKTSG